jgi:hypothetical protein
LETPVVSLRTNSMRVILSAAFALALIGASSDNRYYGILNGIRKIVAGSNPNKDAVDAYHAQIRTAEDTAKTFFDVNYTEQLKAKLTFSTRHEPKGSTKIEHYIPFLASLKEVYADSVTLSVSPDKSVPISVETDALLFAESVSYTMTKFKHCRDLYDELERFHFSHSITGGTNVVWLRDAINLAIPKEKRAELYIFVENMYSSFVAKTFEDLKLSKAAVARINKIKQDLVDIESVLDDKDARSAGIWDQYES